MMKSSCTIAQIPIWRPWLPCGPFVIPAIHVPWSWRERLVCGFHPNIIDGGLSRPKVAEARQKNPKVNQNVTIPLYGKIAAGLPIEAVKDQTETVTVPAGLLGNGTYYALMVEGDSMIDAGIFDGDLAVIEATDLTENGEIVVALVGNDEVTLKRIRRKGKSIALEPANDAYETRIFGPDQISIQGRLKALIRQY